MSEKGSVEYGRIPEQKRLERELVEKHASVLSGLTPATIVMTREGETPVEWLSVGDEVLTRDKGFVPIAWINRIRFDRNELRALPEYAAVTLPSHRLDATFPTQDVRVSPRQLVMVRSPLAERDYWSNEVLLPASVLGTPDDVEKLHYTDRVSYAQIMLPTHELMMVDGAWVGSLFTGNLGVDVEGIQCPLSAKLASPRMHAARPILSAEEGVALMTEIDALAEVEHHETEYARRA